MKYRYIFARQVEIHMCTIRGGDMCARGSLGSLILYAFIVHVDVVDKIITKFYFGHLQCKNITNWFSCYIFWLRIGFWRVKRGEVMSCGTGFAGEAPPQPSHPGRWPRRPRAARRAGMRAPSWPSTQKMRTRRTVHLRVAFFLLPKTWGLRRAGDKRSHWLCVEGPRWRGRPVGPSCIETTNDRWGLGNKCRMKSEVIKIPVEKEKWRKNNNGLLLHHWTAETKPKARAIANYFSRK